MLYYNIRISALSVPPIKSLMESPTSNQVNKHIQSMGYENIDQFTKSQDLERFVEKICKIISDRKRNWKERQAALKIIEILATEALQYPSFHELVNTVFVKKQIVKDLALAFNEQMADNRSEIIKQCSHSVQALCSALNARAKPIALRIFPVFLKGLGRSNEVIRNHTNDAITKIIKNVHHEKLMFLLFDDYGSTKNMELQQHCCLYFQLILQQWPFHSMMQKEDRIRRVEEFMRQCLKGKSKDQRHCSAKSFWYYIHHFPERKQPFLNTLTPRIKSLVMLERLDKDNNECHETQDDLSFQSKPKRSIKSKRKRPASQKPRSLQSKQRHHSHPNYKSMNQRNQEIQQVQRQNMSTSRPKVSVNTKYNGNGPSNTQKANTTRNMRTTNQTNASNQNNSNRHSSGSSLPTTPRRVKPPTRRLQPKYKSMSNKPSKSPNSPVMAHKTYSNHSNQPPRPRPLSLNNSTVSKLRKSTMSKSGMTENTMTRSEIDSIFNVNFDEFQISSEKLKDLSNLHPVDISSVSITASDEQVISPSMLDPVAAELHTEFSFYKSQVCDTLGKGTRIMAKLKAKEDIQSIEEMINLFTKQRDQIDFIVRRFRIAQTACTDVESCEL